MTGLDLLSLGPAKIGIGLQIIGFISETLFASMLYPSLIERFRQKLKSFSGMLLAPLKQFGESVDVVKLVIFAVITASEVVPLFVWFFRWNQLYLLTLVLPGILALTYLHESYRHENPSETVWSSILAAYFAIPIYFGIVIVPVLPFLLLLAIFSWLVKALVSAKYVFLIVGLLAIFSGLPAYDSANAAFGKYLGNTFCNVTAL